MILKKADDRSADLNALKGLLADASPAIAKKIETEIRNIQAGNSGEASAAHYLNRHFGESERTAILHDLRLVVRSEVAQIDHLLIHRLQGRAWVLETKNYSGRIACDEHGDWTIWRNKRPTPIASPIEQAKRQAIVLERWFAGIAEKIDVVPVVLISPNSSVDRRFLRGDAHVVKADNIAQWWSDQADRLSAIDVVATVAKNAFAGRNADWLRTICKRLCEDHEPAAFDWARRFGMENLIEPDERPAGVENLLPDKPGELPEPIVTIHGSIRFERLKNGRYAISNDRDDALIAIVKAACRGRAKWNRFGVHWVVEPAQFEAIKADIIAGSSDLQQ